MPDSRIAKQGTIISWTSPATRIICITEYGKGDDEGKWATVFHGFFRGAHGEHTHRKINFRQVSEHTEPKVN